MKYLVTGSAGLVGGQVVKDLSQNENKIFAGYHNIKPEIGEPIQIDLTNHEKTKTALENVKPEIIIHLAALTNVDLCETEKNLAIKINAEATEVIARQANNLNSFMIYVSTDYVFDGQKGMQTETDEPNPVDFYGKSKLEGEKAVTNLASEWCIARLSTPYGHHPRKKTFPVWVAQNLKAKKEISVVIDQFTSPTYVPNLSRMLIEISKRRLSGIIHLAGATRISRFDMACLIADKLKMEKNILKKITVDEMNWNAKRPKDSSLDVSKATKLLMEKPYTVKQGLDDFKFTKDLE